MRTEAGRSRPGRSALVPRASVLGSGRRLDSVSGACYLIHAFLRNGAPCHAAAHRVARTWESPVKAHSRLELILIHTLRTLIGLLINSAVLINFGKIVGRYAFRGPSSGRTRSCSSCTSGP